jgi:hypothetical protein
MNLYSIKPHDGEALYYATGASFGQAVRKYKRRRKVADDLNLMDWKDVPEPSKVVLVCAADRLIAGREDS